MSWAIVILAVVGVGVMWAVVRSFSQYGFGSGLVVLLFCGVPVVGGLLLLAPAGRPRAPYVTQVVQSNGKYASITTQGDNPPTTPGLDVAISVWTPDPGSIETIAPKAQPTLRSFQRLHSIHLEFPRLERSSSRNVGRTALSLGSVGLFLYLLFLLFDGVTRGQFRRLLLFATAVAFVATCLAVLRLH